MANLTKVEVYCGREAGFSPDPGNIRFRVYAGTDPDNPGTQLFSQTVAYSTLPVWAFPNAPAIGWTGNMNVNSTTGFIIEIQPDEHDSLAGGFSTFVYSFYMDSGTPTDDFLYYRDFAPYATYSVNAFAPQLAQLTVDSVVVPTATGWSGLQGGLGLFASDGGVELDSTRYVIVYNPQNPPEKATTPSYPDQFNSAPNGYPATLTWLDGGFGEENAATGFDLMLGTTTLGGADTLVAEDIVPDASGVGSWDVPQDIQQILGNMPSSYFEALTQYDWYVISKNAVGETDGDTWQFTTNAIRGLGGAHTPTPITTATGQSVTINAFTWLGCEGSAQNTVYMGQVSGQLSKKYTVTGSQLSVNPSAYKFAYGDTTYWRVDTTNGLGTVTGTEWSMTFLTLGNGDGTGIIVTPAGPWGAGGSPTKRLATMLTNKGIWYEDLL